MTSFDSFFNAYRVLVFLCDPLWTTPNLPSPKVFPILKSSMDSDVFLFVTYFIYVYLNLLGGDRVKELLVDVGDAIFLNFCSSKYFGSLGVLHS